MKEITKYVCEKCGSEYYEHHEALACETLMEPENYNEYNIGDEINFQNEDSMFGSRYSYTSLNGKVIDKTLIKSNSDGLHHTLLFVEAEYSSLIVKRGVVFVPEEGWFSPHELNYGYA